MPLAQDEAVSRRLHDVIRVNVHAVMPEPDEKVRHRQVAADVHRSLIMPAQIEQLLAHVKCQFFQAHYFLLVSHMNTSLFKITGLSNSHLDRQSSFILVRTEDGYKCRTSLATDPSLKFTTQIITTGTTVP